jgi:hypothetical protein
MDVTTTEILSDDICFLCLEKPIKEVRCIKKCALVVCDECFQTRDMGVCPYGHPYRRTSPYKKICLDLFLSVLMAMAIDVSIYLVFYYTANTIRILF